MARSENTVSGANPGFTRRRFLQLIGGGLAWLAARPRRASMAGFRVGIGRPTDAYAATLRAVEACGEWPGAALADKQVIIKPNLVVPMTAQTGVTTDPHVVRALVDLALEGGARQVLIVESGPNGANFAACGYGFFDGYDPDGRVALVDLNNESATLTEVPGGSLAYRALYMPELVLANDVVFISAAKLKCHLQTHATLTVKNLMGLPSIKYYRVPPEEWRFAIHRRGINQAIVDINLVRPIDFAVVDGVVGREGNGPVLGAPIELGLVVAGRNPVAVDRVCLWATGLPQMGVQHLTYAARKGLGPGDMSEVELLGDPFTPESIAWPELLPPIVEYPQAVPAAFVPRTGQRTEITYWVDSPCWTRVEIIYTSELSPEETLIRTLHDWVSRPAGEETLEWDGRDENGYLVPTGRYTVQVQARYSEQGTSAYATAWVWVCEHTVYIPALFRAAR